MATRSGIARRAKPGARRRTELSSQPTRKSTKPRTWTGGETGVTARSQKKRSDEPRTGQGSRGKGRKIGGDTVLPEDRHGVGSRSRHKFKAGGAANKRRHQTSEPEARGGPRRTRRGERVGSGERPVRGRS